MEKPVTRAQDGAKSSSNPRRLSWVNQHPYQSQVRRVVQPPPPPQAEIHRPPRRRKWRWLRRLVLVAAVLVLIVTLIGQANGSGGAFAADMMRSIIGPSATARIEATYLDLLDKVHSVQYRLSGQSVAAPWVVNSETPTAVSTAVPSPTRGASLQALTGTPTAVVETSVASATASPTNTPRPPKPVVKPVSMLLAPIPPVIQPALAGEGQWTTDGLPGPLHSTFAPCAKTFLRPDSARPYALVTLLQVDLRVARLHIVAGIQEPGGPLGMAGTGLIPQTDLADQRLLAVFNGGFKYADGQYGLMSTGTVYVPPVWGAATIAVTRGGKVFMGSWGDDKRLNGANHDLVAWRQNAGLLIDHGRISPQTKIGASWGLTLLDSTYTWRSGIGMTRNGTLLYAAGSWLSAETLARALRAAGAVTAMQLDINPFWVRAFTYSRDSSGQLTATPLNPNMQGTGTEYLYGHVRDFFYITRSAGA